MLMPSTFVPDDLTFTDMFCGAGGASLGLFEAGWRLVLGINHWARAIETHAANFTDADHWCVDTSTIQMRSMPKTILRWASPICTEVSPAGGRSKKKQRTTQMDLFEAATGDHVPTEAFEHTRATFWDVLRDVEVNRPLYACLENVPEVADWILFDPFLHGMATLDYEVQFISVNSAHVGDPDNPHAPQWRDRLYMLFTLKGAPVPDVDPRPIAWCTVCDELVEAHQSWKPRKGSKNKVPGRRIGKYGRQYIYRCPNQSCHQSPVEPFVLPAVSAIDWTNLGTRIGDMPIRKYVDKKTGEVSYGPKAPATMRRIETGIAMFAEPVPQPVITQVHGQTWERPGSDYIRAWPAAETPLNARTGTPGDAVVTPPFTVPAGGTWRTAPVSLEEPMPARTTSETDALVVPPFMVSGYSGGTESRVKPVTDPMHTVVANGRGSHQLVIPPFVVATNHDDGGRHFDPGAQPLPTRSTKIGEAVVTAPGAEPFITMLRANGRPRGVDEPLATLSTGRNHAVTVPPGAFVQKHHGGLDYKAIGHMLKNPATDPMPTVVGRPNLSLVVPFRRGAKPHPADAQPLSTVATRETHSLLTSDELHIAVEDCHFRMLQPREHLAAQRFTPSYIVHGNKGEQTMQAGNAVSANVAHWIGRCIIDALTGRTRRNYWRAA